MAVPKRKISPMRRGKRRSHHGLVPNQARECPNCGEYALPHRLCGVCGEYRSRKVLTDDDADA